jgi:hypothetical protein
MSEDWTAIAADVTAAIADVGFDVSVSRKDSANLTPWDTAPTRSTLTVRVIDAKPWRNRIAGGSEVQTGRSLLCAPSANVPLLGDRVTVRGVEHEVIMQRAVAPGGVDLFHVVELSA